MLGLFTSKEVFEIFFAGAAGVAIANLARDLVVTTINNVVTMFIMRSHKRRGQ